MYVYKKKNRSGPVSVVVVGINSGKYIVSISVFSRQVFTVFNCSAASMSRINLPSLPFLLLPIFSLLHFCLAFFPAFTFSQERSPYMLLGTECSVKVPRITPVSSYFAYLHTKKFLAQVYTVLQSPLFIE